MKAIHIRLYTGDIRPYLHAVRLKSTGQGVSLRVWVAWESFPPDGGSGPLKLAARATLQGDQVQTDWNLGSPPAPLQEALQRLVAWIKKMGSSWMIRRPGGTSE